MRILVFIPMYNCEKQVHRVIEQFDKDIRSLFSEILVVDNISQDCSINVAKEALSKIKDLKVTLIQNNNNVNLGGSHKVAFNYAIENSYDYVVVLHGDDQGSIRDIVPYIKDKSAFQYDAFLGSRFMKNSKITGYSFIRILGNHILNFLYTIVTRKRITDMGSGLNFYKTEFLKSKCYLSMPNSLTFNNLFLLYIAWKKSKFGFFPILWREDDQVSNAKMFKQGWEILKFSITYFFSPDKLFNNSEYMNLDFSYTVYYQNEVK